nr:MAG TPA: head closure knob [Caudoviricetes sp.]
MVGGKSYAAAIKSLWRGKCTVTVRNNDTTDENTGRVVVGEVDTYTDEPCRISFDTVNATQTENNAANIVQSITLFIDRAVVIPEGSKITVTQNGATAVYEKSGKPAVYSTHQEIPLEIFKGWA